MEERKNIESYKELIAYQKGYQLALLIYEITRLFKKEEIYGIISQMRRSAVSIPCNIAEGYRRNHRKEYIQFLYVAYGSCSELETLLSLSNDFGFIDRHSFSKIYGLQEETSRLLKNLIRSLSKR
jgi:four helix bundle protein